jgi:hypothetical protein
MMLFFPGIGFGQENCKVLKSGITESYTGGCKKGLAHGQGVAEGADKYAGQFRNGLPDGTGTYTWENGEIYIGEWKEGNRHGIGKYTFIENEKQAILDGQWIDDKYTGPVIPKPLVVSKEGVDRYTFRKNGNIRNRVMVDIFQNGTRNTGITDFMISSSSGHESKLGSTVGYDDVTYPVTIKLIYNTQNKFKTAIIYVKYEFKIYEPGDWIVEVHN